MTETALARRDIAAEPETTTVPMGDTRPWKIVTHIYPDTDAFACLWAAIKFIVGDAEYTVCFVRAGEQLSPEECDGYRVLHMDTGKGDLDQHEKSLKMSSSFKMLAEKYGFDQDPGIVPILNLTVASDNVEAIPRTDMHYLLKGLAYQYKDPSSKEVDWGNALTSARMMFDIIYSQARLHHKNVATFERHGEMRMLRNGLKLAYLGFRPEWREAAFEKGADVAVFFSRPEGHERDKHGPFYALIQCHRKYNKGGLVLDRVIAALRTAEAKERGIQITKDDDVWAIGSNPRFGAWMMHDSHCFISCGTRSHPLVHDIEYTKLSPTFIFKTAVAKLDELIR